MSDLLDSGLVGLDELVDEGLLDLDDLADGNLTKPLGQIVNERAASLRDLIAEELAGVEDLILENLDLRELVDSGLANLGDLVNNGLIDRDDLDLSDLSLDKLREGLQVGAASKVYWGDGAGGFAAPTSFFPNSPTQSIDVGDVDGDGDLDVVIANLFADPTYVENLGGRTFADAVSIADLNQFSRAIALADVDGDGDLDVAVGNYGIENKIYYFDGASELVRRRTGERPQRRRVLHHVAGVRRHHRRRPSRPRRRQSQAHARGRRFGRRRRRS